MSDNYSKLDSISFEAEESWDDPSSGIESPILIEKANKLINLNDYLINRLSLDIIVSHSGWTRRTFCPFHKHGHERTPSFFINPYKNIFYCQACEAKGGIVQYISLRYNVPENLVAANIIKLFDSKTIEFNNEKNRLEEKKKIQKEMLNLCEYCNVFIKKHNDDTEALAFAHKAMEGFDNTKLLNKKGVEKNIKEIVINLKNYFDSYDKKENL